MAVQIDLTGEQPRIGSPAALFRTHVPRSQGSRDYTVSSDGRFLIITAEEDQRNDSINVVLNWLERLR